MTALNIDTENYNSNASSNEGSRVEHLWFCEYPGFNTQLIFFADQQAILAQPCLVSVYDADGFLINQARVAFSNENPGFLDLELLTSGCKLESGLKHGHLEVSLPVGVSFQSRLMSMREAWINNQVRILSKRSEVFYPIRFAPDRSTFIVLVNHANEPAEVRFRLFCGTRSPRTDVYVPAMGARIFNLDPLFPEYGYIQDQIINAYVRVSSRTGGTMSCFFMERLLEKAEKDIFQTIC